MRKKFASLTLPCLIFLFAAASVQAAQRPGAPMTLSEALALAAKNYPSIRVSQEQANAVAAGIRLARTAYLPKVDALAQVNRATRNNVFGMLFPQSVIPPISGPVLGTNNTGSSWGTAVGGMVTWEPFDFGLRQASVNLAETARVQSEAALKRTEFEVSTATADAYLTLAAAEEMEKAALASVDRAAAIARSTNALVGAQLRPGADGSRAEAELASAKTQVAQTHQAVEMARAALSQFTGIAPERIQITAPALVELPSAEPAASGNVESNPLVGEQNATVEQARAQLRALERSYFPKFALQAAAYSRGSGSEITGARLGSWNGLAPDVQNYALGFSVTFTISDLPALHAREAAQAATIRAQAARTDQIITELRGRWNTALAQLHGARQVAANIPVAVSAARAATAQSMARYDAGLGAIDEVAEAQRLLTQSEIDDALSHLNVWRALLGLAAAAGDLQPFLAEAGR